MMNTQKVKTNKLTLFNFLTSFPVLIFPWGKNNLPWSSLTFPHFSQDPVEGFDLYAW